MVFGGKKKQERPPLPQPKKQHPTLEDNDKPRPCIIFSGRFEMNRRRH